MQLQNLNIDEFLSDYWQKKPCLIRNAFANFESVISPEELAGLACDEDVFSRLLIEKEGAHPWQLINGPFSEEDFLNLPETHYSLLVSECEKWLPELNELLDNFNFLPQWRIDDLMISYAPEHGSVGPHLDQYDVFLLQAHGQRHWHIQSPDTLDPSIVDDLDVALLENFNHDTDWILNPGDMLYLPAGVPHHGIALNPCMSYSIGFRAPSNKELLEGVINTLSNNDILNDTIRYTDPTLNQNRHASQITGEEVAQVEQLISKALTHSSTLMPQVSGEVMTQKSLNLDLACNVNFNYSEQQNVERHPDALFAFYQQDNSLLFFANGQSFELSAELLETVQFICEHRDFDLNQLPLAHTLATQSLIDKLIKQSLLLI